MGRKKFDRQLFRVKILAMAVLVCAWLLPTSVGIASAASSNMKVTLTVMDAVGVNYGRAALSSAGNQSGQASTEFVTRTASSRLADGMEADDAKGPDTITEHGVPFGPGTETGVGDAVPGDDDSNIGESEVTVTVINL